MEEINRKKILKTVQPGQEPRDRPASRDSGARPRKSVTWQLNPPAFGGSAEFRERGRCVFVFPPTPEPALPAAGPRGAEPFRGDPSLTKI
ncbi:hypothetical protein MC885_020870 [Smutsia gigantea]|nr:hypothetical protein MC885_020870 [Smutsia gigantea]